MKLSAPVRATLDTFAAHGGGDPAEGGGDPGPLVLAAPAARSHGGAIHERALARWLDELEELLCRGSLAFGPAGPLSGLAAAAPIVRGLGRLKRSLWDQVASGFPRDAWRTREVTWPDYDVIGGPAGMLPSLVASGRLLAKGAAGRRRLALRCARHLLSLGETEKLASFRRAARGSRRCARLDASATAPGLVLRNSGDRLVAVGVRTSARSEGSRIVRARCDGEMVLPLRPRHRPLRRSLRAARDLPRTRRQPRDRRRLRAPRRLRARRDARRGDGSRRSGCGDPRVVRRARR